MHNQRYKVKMQTLNPWYRIKIVGCSVSGDEVQVQRSWPKYYDLANTTLYSLQRMADSYSRLTKLTDREKDQEMRIYCRHGVVTTRISIVETDHLEMSSALPNSWSPNQQVDYCKVALPKLRFH